MAKYLSLCKVEFVSLVSSLMHRKKSSGAILILPFVIMAFMSLAYTLGLKTELTPGGVIYFLLFISLLLVLTFGFSIIGSVLLNYHGVERLLPYPVPKWMILAAKLTVIYAYMLLASVCLMLPGLLVSGADGKTMVSCVVMTLFLPSIPMVFAGIVMSAGKALVAKLRLGMVLKYVLGIIGFIVLLGGLIYMQFSILGGAQDVRDMTKIMSSIPFYSLYFDGLLTSLAATAAQVLLLVLFILAVSRFVWRETNVITAAKNTKWEAAKSSSMLSALIKKEAGFYFSMPIYVFNTIPTPVIIFIGAVVLAVKPDLLSAVSEAGIEPYIIVTAVICFALGLGSTTNSSISLEGTRLYQLKSMPIPAFKLFMSKVLFNMLMVVPSSVIVCVVMGLRAFGPAETLVFVLEIISIGALVSLLGLLVNIKFPMLDYTTPTAVVKQSTAVMITIFGGMGLSVVIFVLSMVMNLGMAALFFGVILAIDAALVLYLKKHSERMLSRL